MSAPIASKNLYDLLGNDPELDPDREPEPPTKAIDKPVARTGKRNGPAEPPARVADASRSTRGGQRDGNSNDSAFKDRGVGSNQNRNRGSGEPPSEYRGRGGRGGRGGRRGGPHAPYSGDRHSRTGVVDTEKQVAHGWGGATGGDEWADEKAGEAIAKEDEKTDGAPVDADAANEEPAAEAEPEDKTKSYDEYLAELAQKKLGLAANVRKANEGTSKTFPEGKPLSRDDEEDAYIAGSGGKAKRERERKQKTLVELDDSRLHSAPRESFGGRGRGGRGRGEFRGGEGRGRGGRGRGEARGRGGRGQSSGGAGPNVTDTRAFPSLGA